MLTERQNDNEAFINVYKDIHGFKPRGHYFFDGTDAERTAAWGHLENARNYDAEMRLECDHLEGIMIQNLIIMGAGDANTAITWMKG